jgi:hypothetical protein
VASPLATLPISVTYIDLTEHGDVMGVLPFSKLPVTHEEYDALLRAKGFTQCRAGFISLTRSSMAGSRCHGVNGFDGLAIPLR